MAAPIQAHTLRYEDLRSNMLPELMSLRPSLSLSASSS